MNEGKELSRTSKPVLVISETTEEWAFPDVGTGLTHMAGYTVGPPDSDKAYVDVSAANDGTPHGIAAARKACWPPVVHFIQQWYR